jgi:hypothetical protein
MINWRVQLTIRNTYKQKIPFETELKMKGIWWNQVLLLMFYQTVIIVSAEVINTTQNSQIAPATYWVKQAIFALLLLNRFIGENPFASEAGSSVASIAKRKCK